MEQARISSSQGTQAPHTTRNRQSGDTAGATGSPGSFLALLSAQDEVIAPGDMPGDAANAAANVGGMALDVTADSVDTSALAAWQGLVTPDAAGVLQTTVPDATGMSQTIALGAASVTQTAMQGPIASASSDTAPGWVGTFVGGDGLRQGLVGETALLDGAADLKEGGLQGPVAGYGRILSRMQSALAQRAFNVGSGVPADAATGRSSLGVTSQHAVMSPSSLASVFQGVSEHASTIAAHSPGIHVERNGGLASAAFAPESLSADGWGLAAVSVSARSGDAQTGGRPGDGQSGGASWSDGAVGAAPLEAGGVDGASLFADPTQVVAEEYVTDQVAYWVNQKTQNAELTLDRDGQPVEVSVSLSGNEAHVTFRSDQSETRDLLDRSMAQLSDLLRSEGLVLSGMSVGTSAGDGAGANNAGQPRNREGTRQSQVVSSAPAGNAAAPKVGGATDRTVDVYV